MGRKCSTCNLCFSPFRRLGKRSHKKRNQGRLPLINGGEGRPVHVRAGPRVTIMDDHKIPKQIPTATRHPCDKRLQLSRCGCLRHLSTGEETWTQIRKSPAPSRGGGPGKPPDSVTHTQPPLQTRPTPPTPAGVEPPMACTRGILLKKAP